MDYWRLVCRLPRRCWISTVSSFHTRLRSPHPAKRSSWPATLVRASSRAAPPYCRFSSRASERNETRCGQPLLSQMSVSPIQTLQESRSSTKKAKRSLSFSRTGRSGSDEASSTAKSRLVKAIARSGPDTYRPLYARSCPREQTPHRHFVDRFYCSTLAW